MLISPSTLVTFHIGNRSIQGRDTDISISIGSSLHFDHNMFVTMPDQRSLSMNDRCGAFDAGEKAILVVRVSAPWFSNKSQVRSFMAKAFDPLSVVPSAVDFIYGES